MPYYIFLALTTLSNNENNMLTTHTTIEMLLTL